MEDYRTGYLDLLDVDMDYQDRLFMERSAVREFIDTGQATILYIIWSNIDNEEQALRESMFPEYFNTEGESDVL
jgi:hypothetical protein